MQHTLPRREYVLGVRSIQVGQRLTVTKVLGSWLELGYEMVSVVQSPGTFSRRGGIIDVFPMHAEAPVRIELFGSQIESLRRFDPATQRSQERVEGVTITPASEALPRHGPRIANRVAELLGRDQQADVREAFQQVTYRLSRGAVALGYVLLA